MRAVPVFVATVALLSPFALADFYIYDGVSVSSADDTAISGFYFLSGPPDCRDIENGTPISGSDDVSGSHTGVRCVGCGDGSPGSTVNPTELEFNEPNYGHYTWYSDRDGALVDTDGNQVGTCNVDSSDSYDCTDPTLSHDTGLSNLFCSTDLAIP